MWKFLVPLGIPDYLDEDDDGDGIPDDKDHDDDNDGVPDNLEQDSDGDGIPDHLDDDDDGDGIPDRLEVDTDGDGEWKTCISCLSQKLSVTGVSVLNHWAMDSLNTRTVDDNLIFFAVSQS